MEQNTQFTQDKRDFQHVRFDKPRFIFLEKKDEFGRVGFTSYGYRRHKTTGEIQHVKNPDYAWPKR